MEIDKGEVKVAVKKGMKLSSIAGVVGVILGVIVYVLAVNGAFTSEKVFTKAGMSITLNSTFYEKDYAAYTAYYESSRAGVVTLKEEFTVFKAAGISDTISLNKYAEIVLSSNKLDSKILTDDGLTYFTYEKEIRGKQFTYYATVFRGKDAYWLVQFFAEKDKFESMKPDFVKMAKTVKFE
ncbi:hypothetical protein [Treponema sp. R6D11]